MTTEEKIENAISEHLSFVKGQIAARLSALFDAELEKKDEEIARLKQIVNEAESDMDGYKHDAFKLKDENQQLRQRLDQLEEQIDRLKLEIVAHQEECNLPKLKRENEELRQYADKMGRIALQEQVKNGKVLPTEEEIDAIIAQAKRDELEGRDKG